MGVGSFGGNSDNSSVLLLDAIVASNQEYTATIITNESRSLCLIPSDLYSTIDESDGVNETKTAQVRPSKREAKEPFAKMLSFRGDVPAGLLLLWLCVS